jgi:hypothetical protein
MRVLRASLFASALFATVATAAHGQRCPEENPKGPSIASEVRTLEGKLVYHDSIRKWFELKLDQPQCGQTSTELVPGDLPKLQVLRGCRVRSKGALFFSPTGYYSLDTAQSVDEIVAIGDCMQQSPFPEEPKAKPDKRIRAYRVDMHVNYAPGDHPVVFRISSAGKELHPWQVYASYILTGGFVLYGMCGDGFAVDKVFGTAQADPSHFDEPGNPSDRAMFEPEGAAAVGVTDQHLSYTCVRAHEQPPVASKP